MNTFGWSYPPGCDGVPDDDIPDPHPESERICELLESEGVRQDVIDDVCNVIDSLVADAAAECPECLERYVKSELGLFDEETNKNEPPTA